jgi:hypothetical protein
MFGGLEKPDKNTDQKQLLPKSDLYAIRIVNNATVEWTLKQCLGDVPFPRAYHSACKVQEDKMFIFGGCYTSNERYNDTYYLKLRKYISNIQPCFNGFSRQIKSQLDHQKMLCPRSEDHNQEHITPCSAIKIKSSYLEDMEV